MRYLLTLLFAALSLNIVGQTNPNYNPDYDADGFISVNDVLGVLSTFGDTWDSGDVIVGCTYPAAVEYNSSANVDDGSCTFPVDCAGVLNGTSLDDECGVCGGDNSCLDECGVPNGDNSTCAGCDGVANSGLVNDDCGVCGGDGSSCFEPAEFTSCGDDMSHEGYNYSTVQIGDQCWFAENCRYLPEVSPSNEGNTTDPYYYVYGYEGTDVASAMSTSNYETYGVLYNWPAVMTEGICPSGWHIPSVGEFTQLTDYLGGEGVAGGKMKEAGYDHWNSPNIGATNSSGWTGLPAGFRYHAGPYFQESGSNGYWWTTAEAAPYPLTRNLNDYSGEASQGSMLTEFGCSARCVRDYKF